MSKSTPFEVRGDLSDVDGGQLLDGLELDDQLAADQKIDATLSDAESLVLHGKRRRLGQG